MTDDIRQIANVDEFRALAHPLRVKLLGALREHGPATATELAQRFDTDTGSTSYHLRKLAEFGFIAETDEPGHPRAKRWQAVHRLTDWDPVAMAGSAQGREAVAVIRRQQLETLATDIRGYEAAETTLPTEWIEASGIGDLVVRLTPTSLNDLWQRFYAHVDELVAQDAAAPDARTVSVIVSGLPR
ncbi:helix-turn-helix domain-containing protein [Catellatospora sp. KI3]|uniref:helix-turn-helix domain-containing protein n=1 Tax=Catellatospora sp. KI3 TaxID=3041620 RepID=UPI0024830C2C|nr:helix-turn-helix domain-containing protein [Catellatospora sp. KI3]MDI1462115.1 helix-turn-helix domain-containing protein [Catellatospora sp. KI3]